MLTATDPQIGGDFSGLHEDPDLLTSLVGDPTSLDTHVLPLLEAAERAENWYVACVTMFRVAPPCRSSSGLRARGPGSTTIRPRGFSLLLSGGASPAALKKAAEAVDETLPDSRIVVMSGRGHAAMDTGTDLFTAEVLTFV